MSGTGGVKTKDGRTGLGVNEALEEKSISQYEK